MYGQIVQILENQHFMDLVPNVAIYQILLLESRTRPKQGISTWLGKSRKKHTVTPQDLQTRVQLWTCVVSIILLEFAGVKLSARNLRTSLVLMI
jgi:hypothetical protein